MSLFKTSDIKPVAIPQVKQPAGVKRRAGKTMHLIGKSIPQLRGVIGELEQGTSIHFVTHGRWSMHELLGYILFQIGPARVSFSTWTVTEEPIRAIVGLVKEGLITELNCLFDYRIKDRKPEAFQLLQNHVTRLKLGKCHAKVLVAINDRWGVTVIGSANFSKNPRIEAGVIATDLASAQFHEKWILDEIDDKNPLRDEVV